MIDIAEVAAQDLTDIQGAIHILKERHGLDFSPDYIHYQVRQGKLSAFGFQEGELTIWQAGQKWQGKTLLLLKREVLEMPQPPRKRGRKGKQANNGGQG